MQLSSVKFEEQRLQLAQEKAAVQEQVCGFVCISADGFRRSTITLHGLNALCVRMCIFTWDIPIVFQSQTLRNGTLCLCISFLPFALHFHDT